MDEFIRYEVDLDRGVREALVDRGSTFEQELRALNPNLKVDQSAPAKPGSKDLATIITATAALAPVVVPVLTQLWKRLFPHREVLIEVEETGTGIRRCKIHVKES